MEGGHYYQHKIFENMDKLLYPSLGNLVNLVMFSCKLHEERSFIKMSKIISESLYGKSVDCAGDRLRFQRFLKNRKSDLQIVLQYFQCTNSQGN